MKEEKDIEKENFINEKKAEFKNSPTLIKENRNIIGLIKSIFERFKNWDIQDEFIKDFSKKYYPIGLDKNEDIEVMKKDFATIIKYDKDFLRSMITRPYGYYFCSSDITEVKKIEIDNKKIVYIVKRKDLEKDVEGKSTRLYLDLFTKINLNERLHITLIPASIGVDPNGVFWDMSEKIIEYDLKNEKLKENLSKEFYFQKFGSNSCSTYLKLNDIIKQRLIEISRKYDVIFSVIINDNLLRIEIHIPNTLFGYKYGMLYNIEKTAKEVLDIFLELEMECK